MDLTAGFTIGRIRGIAIRVHWSWLLIFSLLTWSLSQGLFGDAFTRWPEQVRWTAAITTALLFFLSVLLHELAHAIIAQRYDMVVPSITLFVFGGVSALASEMKTPGQEFRVAIAGPLMSWLLAGVFAAIWFVTRGAGVSSIFGYLGFINGVLGLFNLLPGFPLDGGRVFRSIVWARTQDLVRATRIAARLGTVIAYGMIVLGLLNVFAFGLFSGLWYVLIGLFLRSASEGSYASVRVEAALRDVRTSAVMREPPTPVSGAISLQRLIDERALVTAERAFLVEQDGQIVGMITVSDIAAVDRDLWDSTLVEETMVPAEKLVTVSPDTELVEAMRTMQGDDFNQLPVIENGRLAGVLTRGDVLRHIELRAVLGDRPGSDRPGRDRPKSDG